MGNVNCLRCRFRHEDNGNCTAAGGFCTAVTAAHCPLLCQYLDTGLTPEEVLPKDAVDEQPTADAVEVVRCKDCEHLVNATVNGNGFLICDISDMETAPDDFCSHGDRREEAGP